MKVGFIGTGSMGSILIESFIESGALLAKEIIASNRSRRKVEQLAERYEGLRMAASNKEVVEQSQLVFLCVKPSEFKHVLSEIKLFTLPTQIIVSITSPVMIADLEQQLNCKIAKVIPSITNYVMSGVTLCVYGDRLQQDDKQTLDRLLSYVSEPIMVLEKFTRVSSDISSCGPAFFSLLLQKFIDAAVEESGVSYPVASRLACEMLLGTGKLLTEGGFTPIELQQRVAVPGGITAEGLRLLDKELTGVFNQLFRITHAKYEEDQAKVAASFA